MPFLLFPSWWALFLPPKKRCMASCWPSTCRILKICLSFPQISVTGTCIELSHDCVHVDLTVVIDDRGSRFHYTYYTTSDASGKSPMNLGSSNKSQIERPIYESIQDLDIQGIDILESLSFDMFQAYLADTENTICGRHPIAVLLAALESLREKDEFSKQTLKCLHYDQSSQCKKYTDSSVSYASLYVQIE